MTTYFQRAVPSQQPFLEHGMKYGQNTNIWGLGEPAHPHWYLRLLELGPLVAIFNPENVKFGLRDLVLV
jgi:hypothetical protein